MPSIGPECHPPSAPGSTLSLKAHLLAGASCLLLLPLAAAVTMSSCLTVSLSLFIRVMFVGAYLQGMRIKSPMGFCTPTPYLVVSALPHLYLGTSANPQTLRPLHTPKTMALYSHHALPSFEIQGCLSLSRLSLRFLKTQPGKCGKKCWYHI